MKERICVICGRRFMTKWYQKVCSQKCRKILTKRYHEKYTLEKKHHADYSRGTVWTLDMDTWEWTKEEREP